MKTATAYQTKNFYLLVYDAELNTNLNEALLSILEKGIFTDVVMSSTREIVHIEDGFMTAELAAGVQYTVTRPIAYGEFLRRISRVANIPINTLHTAICAYVQKRCEVNERYINECSAAAFIREPAFGASHHAGAKWLNPKTISRPCKVNDSNFAEAVERSVLADKLNSN